MLFLVQEFFCAMDRYGLRREMRLLAEIAGFVLLLAGGGIALLIHVDGPSAVIGSSLAFALAAVFVLIFTRCANATYCKWQTAALEYQQSDEPPTKLYSSYDYVI